jgi:hypothetical protein
MPRKGFSQCCHHGIRRCFYAIQPLGTRQAWRVGSIPQVKPHNSTESTAQLLRSRCVCRYVKTNFIPTSESGATVSLAQPENFLVALFVLSPTLGLLLFLGCYLWGCLSGSIASVFRAARFFQGPRLVTLFPNGSSTSRPTFPR